MYLLTNLVDPPMGEMLFVKRLTRPLCPLLPGYIPSYYAGISIDGTSISISRDNPGCLDGWQPSSAPIPYAAQVPEPNPALSSQPVRCAVLCCELLLLMMMMKRSLHMHEHRNQKPLHRGEKPQRYTSRFSSQPRSCAYGCLSVDFWSANPIFLPPFPHRRCRTEAGRSLTH